MIKFVKDVFFGAIYGLAIASICLFSIASWGENEETEQPEECECEGYVLDTERPDVKLTSVIAEEITPENEGQRLRIVATFHFHNVDDEKKTYRASLAYERPSINYRKEHPKYASQMAYRFFKTNEGKQLRATYDNPRFAKDAKTGEQTICIGYKQEKNEDGSYKLGYLTLGRVYITWDINADSNPELEESDER